MGKPILCLDFDGVIHSYTSGWQGISVIPDPPVPGAMQFIADAVDHFTVAVYSSRSSSHDGRAAMYTYLLDHITRTFGDERGRAVLAQVGFPDRKPAAFVSIDDRCLTFTGVWPDMGTLRAFKPWNK